MKPSPKRWPKTKRGTIAVTAMWLFLLFIWTANVLSGRLSWFWMAVEIFAALIAITNIRTYIGRLRNWS